MLGVELLLQFSEALNTRSEQFLGLRVLDVQTARVLGVAIGERELLALVDAKAFGDFCRQHGWGNYAIEQSLATGDLGRCGNWLTECIRAAPGNEQWSRRCGSNQATTPGGAGEWGSDWRLWPLWACPGRPCPTIWTASAPRSIFCRRTTRSASAILTTRKFRASPVISRKHGRADGDSRSVSMRIRRTFRYPAGRWARSASISPNCPSARSRSARRPASSSRRLVSTGCPTSSATRSSILR